VAGHGGTRRAFVDPRAPHARRGGDGTAAPCTPRQRPSTGGVAAGAPDRCRVRTHAMTNRGSGWATNEPITQAIEREIRVKMQPGAPPIDVSAQGATVTPTHRPCGESGHQGGAHRVGPRARLASSTSPTTSSSDVPAASWPTRMSNTPCSPRDGRGACPQLAVHLLQLEGCVVFP